MEDINKNHKLLMIIVPFKFCLIIKILTETLRFISSKDGPWTVFTAHFFFITYYLTQKARLFYYTKLESFGSDKYSNLLGPHVSYEENEVFQMMECGFLKLKSVACIINILHS